MNHKENIFQMRIKAKIFFSIFIIFFILIKFYKIGPNIYEHPKADIFGVFNSYILLTLLLIASYVDISKMIIIEQIPKAGIFYGLTILKLSSPIIDWNDKYLLIFNDLICVALTLIIMFLISKISEKFYLDSGLGFGDGKLAAMGAAWVGGQGIMTAMSIAFITAGLFSLFGQISMKLHRHKPFPFGPFISIGIWSVWLMGSEWWLKLWEGLWGM